MPEYARLGTCLLNPVCQISIRALQGKYCHIHLINEEMGEERFGDLSLQFAQLIPDRYSTQTWYEPLVHAPAYPSGCCQSNFVIVRL